MSTPLAPIGASGPANTDPDDVPAERSGTNGPPRSAGALVGPPTSTGLPLPLPGEPPPSAGDQVDDGALPPESIVPSAGPLPVDAGRGDPPVALPPPETLREDGSGIELPPA